MWIDQEAEDSAEPCSSLEWTFIIVIRYNRYYLNLSSIFIY